MDHSNKLNQASNAVGQGYLIIRAATARGAIPLEGAQISVYDYSPEPSQKQGDLIAVRISDRSGSTPPIRLAAPARTASLSPDSPIQPPFSTYTVQVHMEGYTSGEYINVPIFDGITAIQEAELIPLPENGRTDSRSPDSERFFESENPNL